MIFRSDSSFCSRSSWISTIAAHLLAVQAMEQDDLVDPVEELGPERGPHHVHHLRTDGVDVLVLAETGQIFGAEVRRHDDHRVAEVHRAALAVRQPAVVEHLQEHVEDIRMRLLDLVEEHDLVGPAPDRLGQRAAFLVADIAGRRADQPGDGVLLHVFRHVEPHHRALVVEEEAGERLGELRLADARRARGR